jgi:hypothetical protein
VSARRITVFATALALLAAAPHPARAQDATPTPTLTPTATPTASSADAKTDWPKDVQRVYDDYRRDGVIDVCSHTQKTLQDTLDTIEPAYDQDYPDFREAVSAGIERHKSGKCASSSSSDSSAGAGAAAGAGASPTPSATADAGAGSSDSGVESGTLPHTGSGSGSADSGTVPPQDDVPPQATSTPAPTAAPPAATPPPAAAATPQPVVVNEGHRSLALPLALIAIALLAAVALGAVWFFSRRDPRLAHAWREAAFRTRGTWADFSDWLRLGR